MTAEEIAIYKRRNNKRRDEDVPELREAVDDIYKLLGYIEQTQNSAEAPNFPLHDVRVYLEEYRGCELEVWQDRDTINNSHPTYFGMVYNLNTETRSSPVFGESDSLEKTLQILRERADRRLLLRERRLLKANTGGRIATTTDSLDAS